VALGEAVYEWELGGEVPLSRAQQTTLGDTLRMKPKLYNTQRCPYARRTRMVLHEKGIDFDVHEVDLANKSAEFLSVSPTGKVPVVVVDGDSIYESNVVNQYLDEVADRMRLMPDDPKQRAYARIWMAFADTDFFPAVFVASVGRERGYSEDRISEAFEKLKVALGKLEDRLEGRPYLADEFSLADVAHAGNFVRLRELEEREELSLERYPNVAGWVQRIEAREGHQAAV
jgi:glutathione S-transferase